MTWRVAKSLLQLRDQVNARWPGRNKSSDGTIGNAEHAARNSDHNPYIHDKSGNGVVRALDVTHDPASGCDAGLLAHAIVASRDPRVRYVIWNRKIANPKVQDWAWRLYTGANPHNHHCHISVSEDAALYDLTLVPWKIDGVLGDGVESVPQPKFRPILKEGSKGDDVIALQRFLKIKDDGNFGPATAQAVRNKQTLLGIGADGVVGPHTWDVFGDFTAAPASKEDNKEEKK